MSSSNMDFPNIKVLTEDENAFETWNKRIVDLLKRKKLWAIVKSECPIDNVEKGKWDEATEEAISLIRNCVSDDLLRVVRDSRSVQDALDMLASDIVTPLATRAIRLDEKLNNLRLKGDMNINLFKSLLRQLEDFGKKKSDPAKVLAFLRTLPGEYDQIKTCLSLNDSDIKKVFVACVDHHDRHSMTMHSEQPHAMVLSKEVKRLGNKPRFICTSCKKSGHTANKCWSRKQQDAATATNYRKPVCTICGKMNHTKDTCRYNGSEQKKATYHTAIVDLTTSPITCMVADYAFYFVLNSGSKEHIIKCPSLGSDFQRVTDPIHLNLAKQGTSVVVNQQGDLQMRRSKE